MPRWLSLVERVTRNLVVVGLIPTRGSALSTLLLFILEVVLYFFYLLRIIDVYMFSKSCLIDAMFLRHKRLSHKNHTLF